MLTGQPCPLCNACQPEELSDGFRWCVARRLAFRIDGAAVDVMSALGEDQERPISERVTFTVGESARVKLA